MNHRDSNQAGFSGLALLMGLLVALLVAGTGVYLWQHQPTGKQPTPSTSASKSPATAPPSGSTTPGGVPISAGASPNTPSTVTPSNNTLVFKIPEAGLQLDLPASLGDLTYQASGSGNNVRLTFSTKSLSNNVPACSANQANGAFDVVLRGAGQYKAPSNPSDGGLLKQYSDYYFAYLLPSGPCAKGLTPANQVLLDDQAQAFYGALGSAKSL